MSADDRRGAFMFASGMGWYAWRFHHQPLGPVLLMVAGVTLGMWVLYAGDAGVVGHHGGPEWRQRRARPPATSGSGVPAKAVFGAHAPSNSLSDSDIARVPEGGPDA